MEQALSEFLLQQIDLFRADAGDLPTKQKQVLNFYLEKIAKRLIEFRESFTDGQFYLLDSNSDQDSLDLEKGLQNDPELFGLEIDAVLSRLALEGIPVAVKRLIRMSKLTALRIPSGQTAVYIREAARTYVGGFIQASAAMSRAALEQALKERLSYQGKGSFIEFKDLLKQAKECGGLDDAMVNAVRGTMNRANAVLHAKPIGEGGAFDLLIETRGLIQQIYDAPGFSKMP